MRSITALRRHQAALRRCHRCPDMLGRPVLGTPVPSPVLLIGQAPGRKEMEVHRPFAWTAGKTLFKWFASIGLEEEDFRQRVYMAAVCRCYPGKNPRGGDRVPNPEEIANCAPWLDRESELLEPRLILPVGQLAIARFIAFQRLTEVIGRLHRCEVQGRMTDLVPLPHPSGASTWHRTSPGRELLARALETIQEHPAWQRICTGPPA